MNIQNDQTMRRMTSRGDDALPRIQPSCFQMNDYLPQKPFAGKEESNITKLRRPISSKQHQQPREKKISFVVNKQVKRDTDTHSTSDAVEINTVCDDRVTSLLNQMEALQEKIQKAACVELRYLQSLEDVTQRRTRCEEKQREAISRRPRANSGSASAALEGYIADASEKIAKTTKVETAYKRKVKELHDKRYRWSKLYENAGRELLELDPSRTIPSLPPLFTPSFLRR